MLSAHLSYVAYSEVSRVSFRLQLSSLRSRRQPFKQATNDRGSRNADQESGCQEILRSEEKNAQHTSNNPVCGQRELF